jgi:glycosyltransferase involved in cell wall biosynthesis
MTTTTAAAAAAASNKTKISIIIPSFNRAYYLDGALESLTRQETDGRFDYEVVIVDNASKDNTKEVVEAFAATSPVTVRYLHETKPGDAPPRNKGIRESDGDWLAFFDDDQFAEPLWLLNMLDAAESHNTQVVGGPVHLNLDQPIIDKLSLACRSTLREMKPYTVDQPYEVNVIPGTGNMMVSRNLFDEIGLFKEDIKEGGSDWKLVEDARVHGVTPWYAAKGFIRHRVEENRMTPAYFCWDSRNGGVAQADVDYRKHGAVGLLARCAARVLRSALLTPQRIMAAIMPPKFGSAQSSMNWWRTEGYLRRTLTLLAPTAFPQKRFHEYADFRSGRVVGT